MLRLTSCLCFALAFTLSCSSDDDPKAGTGGASSGGNAGTAGAAGAAGSSGQGGSGGTAGSGGQGGTAGSGGQGGAAGAPAMLSQTGLYADIKQGTLASGVRAYTPQFVLWTDGATKKRWVYLPPGQKIDTSDMDYWVYPVGTKLWKEFSRDGKRIETRLIVKTASPDVWDMVAYHWKDDQTDATSVPNGVQNASGTQHDIPSTIDCDTCHGKMKDRGLSFTAIQLSHAGAQVSLDTLAKEGALTNPPTSPLVVPGNATERAALGYMHANCGVCHNDQSFVFSVVDMRLWLSASALGKVSDTPTYLTSVNKALTSANPSTGTSRIVPGNSAESDIWIRMGQRGELTQMPPLGSEDVDATGHAAVKAWIDSL